VFHSRNVIKLHVQHAGFTLTIQNLYMYPPPPPNRPSLVNTLHFFSSSKIFDMSYIYQVLWPPKIGYISTRVQHQKRAFPWPPCPACQLASSSYWKTFHSTSWFVLLHGHSSGWFVSVVCVTAVMHYTDFPKPQKHRHRAKYGVNPPWPPSPQQPPIIQDTRFGPGEAEWRQIRPKHSS